MRATDTDRPVGRYQFRYRTVPHVHTTHSTVGEAVICQINCLSHKKMLRPRNSRMAVRYSHIQVSTAYSALKLESKE